MTKLRDMPARRPFDVGNGWYELKSYTERARPTKRFIQPSDWDHLVKASVAIKVWKRKKDHAPSPLYLLRFYDPQYRETSFALARGSKVVNQLGKQHHKRIEAWQAKNGKQIKLEWEDMG